MNTNNLWEFVPHFEELYIINDQGCIKSLHKRNPEKALRIRIDRAGYYTVRLAKNGQTKTCFLHRLLAETFLTNNNTTKTKINHKNGNKLDNSLTNLEWVTHSENIQHAYKMGLIKAPLSKSKNVIDRCTGSTFKSIREAAIYVSLPYPTVKNMLNGNRKNSTSLEIAA